MLPRVTVNGFDCGCFRSTSFRRANAAMGLYLPALYKRIVECQQSECDRTFYLLAQFLIHNKNSVSLMSLDASLKWRVCCIRAEKSPPEKGGPPVRVRKYYSLRRGGQRLSGL